MKIKPAVAIISTIVLAVIVIASTKAMGIWNLGGEDKTPKLQADGSYSVEDIKGSFTFAEIEEYYGVPVSALAEAFNVDADEAAGFQCKSVSENYPDTSHAVNKDTVKVFVAFFLGESVDLGDGSIYLPDTAVTVIERDGAPTDEQRTYLSSHTFDPTQPAADAVDGAQEGSGTQTESENGSGSGSGTGSGTGSGSGAGKSATDIELTGGNTFIEVSDIYGIPSEDLCTAFAFSSEQYAFLQLKDLKTLYADSPQTIGPGSVKLFVALYDGYDYDLTVSETYLPQSAVDVLKAHGTLTDEQIAYLDGHTC